MTPARNTSWIWATVAAGYGSGACPSVEWLATDLTTVQRPRLRPTSAPGLSTGLPARRHLSGRAEGEGEPGEATAPRPGPLAAAAAQQLPRAVHARAASALPLRSTREGHRQA